MPELITYDGFHSTVIAGATLLDFSDTSKPIFLGATDASGSFRSQGVVPRHLRIRANGYIPVDLTQGLKSPTKLKLTKLHPGTYTGFLANAGITTWASEDETLFLQFTMTGLTRKAQTPKDLGRQPFFQFKCVEDESWAELGTRSDVFPTISEDFIFPINNINQLRFPEPGVMLGRIFNNSRPEVRFKKIN